MCVQLVLRQVFFFFFAHIQIVAPIRLLFPLLCTDVGVCRASEILACVSRAEKPSPRGAAPSSAAGGASQTQSQSEETEEERGGAAGGGDCEEESSGAGLTIKSYKH